MRILKFGSVGIINTILTFVVFNLLAVWLGVSPILANIAAWVVGFGNSYLMNRAWTFGDRGKLSVRRTLPRFAVVNLFGMTISTVVVALLAPHADRLAQLTGLGPVVALNLVEATAILTAVLVNFVLANKWAFTSEGDAEETMAPAADDFDEHVEDYRSIHDENVRFTGGDSEYYARYKVDLVASWGERPTLILDFGCGDGASDKYLLDAFPEASLVGCDVSAKSIDLADSRGLARTTYEVCESNRIPGESNRFDLVFAAGVFHHISLALREVVARELFRVIRSGARLHVFEHNPLNPFTRKIVRDCSFDAHAELLRASNLKKILQGAGFEIERVEYTLFSPRHKALGLVHRIEPRLGWLPAGAQYHIVAVRLGDLD